MTFSAIKKSHGAWQFREEMIGVFDKTTLPNIEGRLLLSTRENIYNENAKLPKKETRFYGHIISLLSLVRQISVYLNIKLELGDNSLSTPC